MGRDLKVVIVGDCGVGKTSFATRLVRGTFDLQQQSTIGVAFQRYRVDKTVFQIWDTAGQERYRSLMPLYYRGADVVIIVYDVTVESRNSVEYWIKEVMDHVQVPCMWVLGAKQDLEHSSFYTEQIKDLCKLEAVHHSTASAKTGQGIVEVFESISIIMEPKPKPVPFMIQEPTRYLHLDSFWPELNYC